MSSLRKIESARANGAKCHGPITPEGKQRSSANSFKHGLTARTLVLSNEARESFDETVLDYVAELKPRTPSEMHLVREMISAQWRQYRCWAIETSTLDLQMDSQEQELAAKYEKLDEPTRLAIAFQTLAENRALATLNRYETGYRRSYHKALATLLALRRERQNQMLRNEINPVSEHSPAEEPVPREPPSEPKNANLRNERAPQRRRLPVGESPTPGDVDMPG